jgi:hypothetical protein
MSNYTRFPEISGGIKIYPSATNFPVNPGKDGIQAVAADTNTIYIFDTTTSTWVPVATPGASIAITSLTSDVSATGPGAASATVNSVGGAAAVDIASATSDVLAATDLSTSSTLMKRDASGETSLDGLNLDGSTSGFIKMQAAATTTSYTVKMPAAQGAASTFLQNDGSGNLLWTAVPDELPAQTGNSNKILATDGSSVSWQYAGLGAGSLGTDNVVVGKAKPTSLTTGVRNVIVGTGTTFDSVSTGSDNIAMGHNVVLNNAPNSVAIGSGSSAPNAQGESVAIGYAAAGGWYSVVVGSNSSTWTGNNGGQVVVGSSSSSGAFGTTLGAFSSGAGGSIAIGRNVTASGSNSIAIGNDSSTDSIAAIMAIGSNGAPIDAVYLGKGAADQTTANAVKIQTQKAAGTNIDLSAGTLTLAGARSTGDKLGGDVILAVAPAGSSGTTLNAHVEMIRAKATKEAKFSGGMIVKTIHGQTGTANVITAVVENYYIGVDCSLAAKTVNLPAASSVEAGKMYVIKDETGNATTNNISIVANGMDLIDGSGSDSLVVDYESITIVCNGVDEWYVI